MSTDEGQALDEGQAPDVRDDVEVVKAERDQAIVMLRKLVCQLEGIGGYMTHKHQEELREARTFIEAVTCK